MPLKQQMPIIYQSCLYSLSCGVLEHCLNWMIGKRFFYVEHDLHQSFCDVLFIYYLFIYLFVRSAPTSWAQRFSFNSENCTPHPPLCGQTWRGHWSISPSPMNRPFPSFPGPLYPNEVNCSVFKTEMIFHRIQIKLILKREVVHSASFWTWGFLELGSGLL